MITNSRKRMIRIQMANSISPSLSVYIGNGWRTALEKDLEGSQLEHFINDLVERFGLKE
jgi:hypothetical protein